MRLAMHVINTTPERPARGLRYKRGWVFIGNFIGMALMLSVVPIAFVLLMRLLVRL